MPKSKCDLCGRPAKYHETSLQGGVASERHLCGVHGNRLWFASFKELFVGQIDDLPAERLPTGLGKEYLKQRIAEAGTLAEARAASKPR